MADNSVLESLQDHHEHQSTKKSTKESASSLPGSRSSSRKGSSDVQNANKMGIHSQQQQQSPKPRNGSCSDISNGKSFINSATTTPSKSSKANKSFFSSSSSNSSSPLFGSNNNGSSTSYTSSSNFQYNQVPVSHNMPRRGSQSRDHFVLGSNSSYHQSRSSFLEKFRSQISIPESISATSKAATRNGSSRSVLTSPVELIPPPSPCSTKSSIGGHIGNNSHYYSNHSTSNGQRPTKPKKWFSFTNLLNRQNISSLLNLPKSRLSVSSTLNSVFVGPISPTPSGSESCPGVGTGSTGSSSAFFGGITNFGFEKTASSCSSFGPGGDSSLLNHPAGSSPTLSNSTLPGDIVNYHKSPLGESISSPPGQVVYRNKSKGFGGGGRRDRGGSNSATSSIAASSPGGNGMITYSGNISSGKHYSSGGSSGCGGGNSESASERSSGVGYYTGYSSGGSSGIANYCGGGSNSGGGGTGSRLSCGEFFTGTPNSPICSGETPTELLQFQFHSGHSSSGFGSREGDGSSSSSSAAAAAAAAAFYSYHKTLGRSLPTLLESMESGNVSSSKRGSTDGGGGGGGHNITVDSVVGLMYQEFAILTGAKSLDDHYILTFPDRGNFHLLSDEDYRRLMIYLTSVPPMHDAESGFVIIIDRRNDKWNSVKTTLLRISSYFPGLIHRVFVLRPVGFIQKALSEVSTKLFRTENLRFRLTVCNNLSDILAFVDPSQLTSDLGGCLCYDKNKWVQQRVEVEAFHLALQSLSRELKGFTESFQDFEYPNDVVSTEELITDKHSEFQRLRSDLSQAGEHGENLLRRIKQLSASSSLNGCGSGESSDSSTANGNIKNGGDNNSKVSVKSDGRVMSRSNSSVQLINVISVERFILQIEETTRLFEEFWVKEKNSLDQFLRLRRFEQDFREMQATFDLNTKTLEELGEIGESLGATDVLIAETLAFEISSTDDISRAIQLERVGRAIVETNQSAVDSVEPKCLELSSMAQEFKSKVQEKIQKQKKWREVQATIEKANQLCNEGMDLMTSRVPELGEDCTDNNSSFGGSLLATIDEFLDRMKVMAEELLHLKTTLNSPSNSQSKPLVKQVLKRVEDVQTMCAKRRSLVVQQMSKSSKSRRSSGSSLISMPGSSISSGSTLATPCIAELKSAKSTSQLDSNMLEDYNIGPPLKSGSSTLSLDGNNHSGIMGRNVTQKEEDCELRTVKRGHVLNELLQTERSYVEEIGEILLEYRDQIRNPEVRSLLPSQLQPTITPTKLQRPSTNIAVLFCNLDEIHAFHSKLFLPDLSNCVGSVELVGLCFIQRHSDFLSMYSQYCQLLPASEALRKEIGENHPWFLACRNRLGHKLPLGAYLLKPVQRITKYHLLLKDLVKNSEGCAGYAELVEALECMLVVLRCVNDGMHQLGINGYPGKLIDEGYLLLQGSFLMWTENKKDRLRLKGHQRHLFLYQRSLLICKKIPKSSSYEFRNRLSLSEVGLTEALKGSGSSKKFEIWVNGRQKVFLLQAETPELKELWVREIKKLLLEQLESLRATKAQTIGACGVGASSLSSMMNISSSKKQITAAMTRRQKMTSTKGITLNGWRPSNIGHRALRQVSSWDNPEPRRPKSRSNDCDTIEDEFWSSEVSNSDEDDDLCALPQPPSRPLSIVGDPATSTTTSCGIYGVGENIENGEKYVALADYTASGPAEVTLKEGDVVILVKIGCGGWWFVKMVQAMSVEGWAPSAYLERITATKPSLSSHSSSSLEVNIGPASTSSSTAGPYSEFESSTNPNTEDTGRLFRRVTETAITCNSIPKNSKINRSTDDIISALR